MDMARPTPALGASSPGGCRSAPARSEERCETADSARSHETLSTCACGVSPGVGPAVHTRASRASRASRDTACVRGTAGRQPAFSGRSCSTRSGAPFGLSQLVSPVASLCQKVLPVPYDSHGRHPCPHAWGQARAGGPGRALPAEPRPGPGAHRVLVDTHARQAIRAQRRDAGGPQRVPLRAARKRVHALPRPGASAPGRRGAAIRYAARLESARNTNRPGPVFSWFELVSSSQCCEPTWPPGSM